jgi:putative membrane protein
MSGAVAVAAWLTDIRCSGPLPALIVGMLLALSQVLIRPALIALSLVAIRRASLPVLVLFFFAVNVLIFWTVGTIVPGFDVEKFSSALGGSVISSIVGFFIHSSLKSHFGVSSPFAGVGTMPVPDAESLESSAPDGMKQAKGRVIK